MLVGMISLPFLLRVNIDCISQYGSCPADIALNLSKFNGKSLVASQSGIKKYLSSNYLVSDFSLAFKIPNIIKVEMIVKKPVFAVQDRVSGNNFLVSGDGKILAASPTTSLPTVQAQISKKIGDGVDEKTLSGLRLIAGVFEMYQVRTGKIDNDSLVVDLPGQLRVIFPLVGKDNQVLLGSLRLIYSKITTESPGKYSQIDLRFENPVLR